MNDVNRMKLINDKKGISPTFKCCICQDLVMDPKECENCSKLFCHECINEWLKNSSQCPNKHIFKMKTVLDEWIKNELNKIYLKCPIIIVILIIILIYGKII